MFRSKSYIVVAFCIEIVELCQLLVFSSWYLCKTMRLWRVLCIFFSSF